MSKQATLKIGSDIQSGTLKEVSESIDKVFKSAYENKIEQETIRSALQVLGTVSKVENVNVSNSVFKGDRTINLNEDEEED